MKILLALAALLVLLVILLVYPVTLAAELNNQILKIYWRPLPGLKWRVTLFARALLAPEVLPALAAGDWRAVWRLLRPAKLKKAGRSLPEGLFPLLTGLLAALHIKRFRLNMAVGGEPARAALLAGALWGVLSAALGWLSFRVAAWPQDEQALNVSLLAGSYTVTDSQIGLTAELYCRPGAALVVLLRQIIGKRCKP